MSPGGISQRPAPNSVRPELVEGGLNLLRMEMHIFRSAPAHYFLPLFFDGANPSPDQGWNQAERQGMKARADADGILALAFVHHLAIAKNIPLDELVAWLISLAPTGVLEFVPKSDPMVGQLLRLREDIFADYTEETFRALISERASIVREEKVSATGRRLIQFAKRP